MASKRAKENFQQIREQRVARFRAAFDPMAGAIARIYKELATSDGGAHDEHGHGDHEAAASLTLENQEEPYLEGIRYTVQPPGKRPLDMDQLSGGERTIAALSLLFAMHSPRPSPFFILDEVDAALDPGNVHRLTTYLGKQSQSQNLQILVISLKHSMYDKADALVGVYRDNEGAVETKGSRVLTLSLKGEPQE